MVAVPWLSLPPAAEIHTPAAAVANVFLEVDMPESHLLLPMLNDFGWLGTLSECTSEIAAPQSSLLSNLLVPAGALSDCRAKKDEGVLF
jgi:hypothetical protein